VGDDAVDPRGRPELLAQGADGLEVQHHGVERIDPFVRVRGRVGRLADELDRQLAAPEQLFMDPRPGEGVDHQRRVDPAEHPGVEEGDLAPAAFFGGGADHLDSPTPGATARGGQEGGGPGRRGRDQVVTAAVADDGQRVVLGQECHRGAVPVGQGRPERGGDATDLALHHVAVGLEVLAEPGGGLHLQEAHLGMAMDAARERVQLGRQLRRGGGQVRDRVGGRGHASARFRPGARTRTWPPRRSPARPAGPAR
jgi:hypothetical protein